MLFNTGGPNRQRKSVLLAFQKACGLRFRELEILDRALTHRSFANEDQSSASNNERLEFLGDAVLGVVVASYLYRSLADRAEGELARVKSFVVSEDTLSSIAAELGVDRVIRVGKGEEQTGGRRKKAILADALEAIIGASYIDQGFEKAAAFVLALTVPEVDKVLEGRHRKDYKTILQEYLQKYRKQYPVYELAAKVGPDHDRTFQILCRVGDLAFGPAGGKSKKEAEREAARMAYDAIVAAGGLEAERIRELG
ncbi:MAG: ribonuclease III [Spirochaetales bacterium]|nr:ribonuclease III [Spirochaetales bacterium]